MGAALLNAELNAVVFHYLYPKERCKQMVPIRDYGIGKTMMSDDRMEEAGINIRGGIDKSRPKKLYAFWKVLNKSFNAAVSVRSTRK